MIKLFGEYQKQLEDKGFDGLRVPVQALEDNLKFVGSETCGQCHSKHLMCGKTANTSRLPNRSYIPPKVAA